MRLDDHPAKRRLIAVLVSVASVVPGLVGAAPARAQVDLVEAVRPQPASPGTSEAPAAAPESAQAPVSPPPAAALQQLSNESTRSQWAYVIRTTTARVEPRRDATPVRDSRGRAVTVRTSVKQTYSDELVLLLRQTTDADGRTWVQVRLPVRPNNTIGWIERTALSAFRVVRTSLVIDRRRLRASLRRGGRVLWTSRIGVGVRRWPTPRGRFYVRERLHVPAGAARKVYGPLAIGTSAHSPTLSGGNWGEGVIGIHGTGRPDLLPGRVSHGCVRVPNEKIRRLWRLMPLGTPILVR